MAMAIEIVSFLMKNGTVQYLCKRLPEAKSHEIPFKSP